MKRNHKTKKCNHKTKKRNHKTKKRNHKTIKKKHRFYAVGSGKMKTGTVPKMQNSHRRYKTMKTGTVPKVQNSHRRYGTMKTMKTGTGKVPNSHRRYGKTPCKYGLRCYSQTRPFLVYKDGDNHTINYSHPSTPPSPRDIITKWIKSEQNENDKRNLSELIFGINIDNETNKPEIFKRFIRYIVINIKQYEFAEIIKINLLLHRLNEDSIDYSIEVNKYQDKDFYEALTKLGFSGKDDDSNVIELHGYGLHYMIEQNFLSNPDSSIE